MNTRQLLRATATCAAAFCLASHATAQDFPPKKPVTLVVGFAAGGAADVATSVSCGPLPSCRWATKRPSGRRSV